MIITPEHPDFQTLLPKGPFARWNGLNEWPEATVVGKPVKNADEPKLLVRREIPDVAGPRNEQLLYLPGEPVISLFTGAGGMDIGTERAGFCTVIQHEWDGSACETLIANRPAFFRHAALIQGDIRKTPTSLLLRESGLRVGEAGMVCGGPPCQGFSTANSKSGAGTYDQRNDLVFEYLRVVREAQPKFFVMENVPGFVTFPGKRDGKTYLESFLCAAYDSYYELVYGLLNAVECGVPQDRTRFICMGTRRDLVECDGMLGSLPKPFCFSNSDLTTLRQLDGGLFQEEHDLLRHAPGIRYFPDRPILVPPRPAHQGQRSISFIEFYRKLREKEPDRIVEGPRGGE